mmetsp:Transcript_7739/g.20007  ORF Transcript_7739/g.20007 Transcript_7739/m.20007 type:complete len:215 (-) Transcript_7739:292-936(-)
MDDFVVGCVHGVAPSVPVREVQGEVLGWEVVVHVVVHHRVEPPALLLGPLESHPQQLLHARDEGRQLVAGMAALVDGGGEDVVQPVETGLNRKQKDDDDLVGEHDGGLQQVEAVTCVCAGHRGLVVHEVHVLVERAPVEHAMGPVEPRVVQVVQHDDGAHGIQNLVPRPDFAIVHETVAAGVELLNKCPDGRFHSQGPEAVDRIPRDVVLLSRL